MINRRAKGASAEREVFKLISTQLGIPVERNLVQTREGGADTSVGGWAIEVKRQEVLLLKAWWEQAVEQSKRVNKKPMLIYRRSRMPWKVVVSVSDFLSVWGVENDTQETLEVSLDMGIQLMRMA